MSNTIEYLEGEYADYAINAEYIDAHPTLIISAMFTKAKTDSFAQLHQQFGGHLWSSGGNCMILTIRLASKDNLAIHVTDEAFILAHHDNLNKLLDLDETCDELLHEDF